MTPDERKKTAGDLAGILARGYDLHVKAHGPDDSQAVRTEDGSQYEVAETMIGGAMSFVERGGERFAVNVIPLATQDVSGPLRGYADSAEQIAAVHERQGVQFGHGNTQVNTWSTS